MIDQPRGGTARWMFDETARHNGFDPHTVVKGGPEHHQVTRQLDAALHALKDAPLPKGEAAQTQMLRGAIRDAVAADGPRLTATQAATVATLPGARTFATPGAQAALRGAAALARHPAAQAGLAVGAAGAIAVGGLTRRDEAGAKDEVRAKPFAGLDQVGERKRDDSCAPEGTTGTWFVIRRGNMSAEAMAYQRQVSGTTSFPDNRMIEYKVTNLSTGKSVDFDGCAINSPNRALLDAKYGYTELFSKLDKGQTWVDPGPMQGLRKEAEGQAEITSRSHPVEWHASEADMVPRLQDQQGLGSEFAPNMTVLHAPAAQLED